MGNNSFNSITSFIEKKNLYNPDKKLPQVIYDLKIDKYWTSNNKFIKDLNDTFDEINQGIEEAGAYKGWLTKNQAATVKKMKAALSLDIFLRDLAYFAGSVCETLGPENSITQAIFNFALKREEHIRKICAKHFLDFAKEVIALEGNTKDASMQISHDEDTEEVTKNKRYEIARFFYKGALELLNENVDIDILNDNKLYKRYLPELINVEFENVESKLDLFKKPYTIEKINAILAIDPDGPINEVKKECVCSLIKEICYKVIDRKKRTFGENYKLRENDYKQSSKAVYAQIKSIKIPSKEDDTSRKIFELFEEANIDENLKKHILNAIIEDEFSSICTAIQDEENVGKTITPEEQDTFLMLLLRQLKKKENANLTKEEESEHNKKSDDLKFQNKKFHIKSELSTYEIMLVKYFLDSLPGEGSHLEDAKNAKVYLRKLIKPKLKNTNEL